jgi:outer membrane biosynthesis protein TonB
MRHWLDAPRYQNEGVTVPRIWVTIVLSLLFHSLALFVWVPRTGLLAPWAPEDDVASDRLQVRLAAAIPPKPVTLPEQPRREVIAVTRPPSPPPQPARPQQPPRVVTAPAATSPTFPAPAPAPPPAPAPQPHPQINPPVAGDLTDYIHARRLERGERDAPPGDHDQTQLNANIAANLPRPATGVATQTQRRGGGIFEVKRMDYDDAAFEFFGWNNEMGRKTPQLIEVRKGDNSTMEIAVVRRMIAIIREYSKEDFIWRSPRRGEDLVLSARPQDNAELENFLMHEFFDDPRQSAVTR